MSVNIQRLIAHADQLLSASAFKDYCPNGLQVQGKAQINKLVAGVTASQAMIEAAIAADADALLVHHGYFWKGEAQPIVGMKYQRIRRLLAHNINLIAYHLPLDAHPELGNNAELARLLGITVTGGLEPDNPYSIGNVGEFAEAISAEALAQRVAGVLQREPLLVPGGDHPINTIGWCSGGGQGFIEQAAALGMDAYLSGEISEQTTHAARELGIHYIAVGHHASERYGVQALGRRLADDFALDYGFIDIDNPA